MVSDRRGGYVSVGGLKLAAALEAFTLDPTGWVCADLGANVGGFTDCLLQRGAARVYAVDTAYGPLAWSLRKDPRVQVMERTNALRLKDPPGPCDLVTVDLGWTPQARAIPAALAWSPTRIISLIKPQYEQTPPAGSRGVWDDESARRIAGETLERLDGSAVRVVGSLPSPQRGGAGKGRAGNLETLALLVPVGGGG